MEGLYFLLSIFWVLPTLALADQTTIDHTVDRTVIHTVTRTVAPQSAVQQTVTTTAVFVSQSGGFSQISGPPAAALLAGATGIPSDGEGVPAGGVGSVSDSGDGSQGTDSGSYGISTGAIVGICVGIGLVVIGISMSHAHKPYLTVNRNADSMQSLYGRFGFSQRSAAGRFANRSHVFRAVSQVALTPPDRGGPRKSRKCPQARLLVHAAKI